MKTPRTSASAPTRRVVIGTSLAALGALSLAACGGADAESASAGSSDGGEGAADHGTLDINLSWIKNAEFAGEYMAIDRGYFEEAGFSEVNLIAGGPSGTSSETMVLSGSAIMGTTSPLGVAPLIQDEEAPLKIIGTTYQKNPFTIISLGDAAPIATPADLVGKKIGVQTGVNETLFDGFLAANGIDAAQLEKVPVQYDPQPLVNGEVDGFFGYLTNEALTLELAGEDVVNLPLADNGLPFMAESIVVTQESIETQRDLLKAALVALIRGWKDAIAEPEEGARLAVEDYGQDLGLDMEKETRQAEEQVALVSTDETDANGLLTMSDELMQQNVDALVAAGYDLTVEDYFDTSLLEEVYAENPDLI